MPNSKFLPTVDGLEVLDVIGRGGHATVYRARQPGHGRIVALKVLDGRIVDEVAGRRFDRERKALGQLSTHPGVVSLLDSGFTGQGAPYLLLEYAPGGSLAERLARGPMSVDETTSLGVRIAGVLEHAHRNGVLHRDIKPENIVMSDFDQWQLTDFSVAAFADDPGATGTPQLSLAHTAPESFDDDPPTPVADVYSLASVLFTSITATEPFAARQGETAPHAIVRLMFDPLPDPRRSGAPDELAVLLEAAMSKTPNRRPPTARAFAMGLCEVRAMLGLPRLSVPLGVEDTDDDTLVVDGADLNFDRPRIGAPGDRARRRHTTMSRVAGFAAVSAVALGGTSFAMQTLGEGGDDPTVASVFDDVVGESTTDDTLADRLIELSESIGTTDTIVGEQEPDDGVTEATSDVAVTDDPTADGGAEESGSVVAAAEPTDAPAIDDVLVVTAPLIDDTPTTGGGDGDPPTSRDVENPATQAPTVAAPTAAPTADAGDGNGDGNGDGGGRNGGDDNGGNDDDRGRGDGRDRDGANDPDDQNRVRGNDPRPGGTRP